MPFVAPVRREEGFRLDDVSQPGAGAVRLHRVDVAGIQPRVHEGLPDHPLLCRSVRCGQPVARSVLVDRRAAHHGQYRKSRPARLGQPAEQQHAGALGPSGAVGGRAEGLAAAVRGQRPLAAELDERRGPRHHRGTAGQREGALAPAQRLGRQVQGHQGRGTRGVHGEGRAFETEGVGDTPRGDASGVAEAEVALDVFGRPRQVAGVVAVHQPDVHPGRRTPQGAGDETGVFEGLPRHFEQQSVLRVHGQGLAGRDAEEAGVEAVHAGEEAALAHIRPSGAAGVRVVQFPGVPAPVGGEGADGVPPVGHQLPQFFGRGHVSGVAAGHSHDHHGVVVRAGRTPVHGTGVGLRGGVPFSEVGGEGGDGGEVEGDGLGERQAGHRRQSFPQHCRRQGVHAQVPQCRARFHLPGRAAEHGRRLVPHQGQQVLRRLPGGLRAQRPRRQSGEVAPQDLSGSGTGNLRHLEEFGGHLVAGEFRTAGGEDAPPVQRAVTGPGDQIGDRYLTEGGCGRPVTAASATPGSRRSTASTSEGWMFTPPRMMRSLALPVIVSSPEASILARSPVRNQPSRSTSAVASGLPW